MTEKKILVVDDEYLIRWTLQKNLEKAGYGCCWLKPARKPCRSAERRLRTFCWLISSCPTWMDSRFWKERLEIDPSLIPDHDHRL